MTGIKFIRVFEPKKEQIPTTPDELVEIFNQILVSFTGEILSKELARAIQNRLNCFLDSCAAAGCFDPVCKTNVVVRGPWVKDSVVQAANRALDYITCYQGDRCPIYRIVNIRHRMEYHVVDDQDKIIKRFEYREGLAGGYSKVTTCEVHVFIKGNLLEDLRSLWGSTYDDYQH